MYIHICIVEFTFCDLYIYIFSMYILHFAYFEYYTLLHVCIIK